MENQSEVSELEFSTQDNKGVHVKITIDFIDSMPTDV